MSKPRPKQQQRSPELDTQGGVVPPHNIEAEQACLGACLLDPQAIDQVAEQLAGPDDFYREAHQEIWQAVQALGQRNQNVDLITVINELRDRGKLELCGGAAYLDMITSMVQTSAHVTSYVRIVVDRALERRLLLAGMEIMRLALNGEVEAVQKVDQAEQVMFEVADRRTREELRQVKPVLQEAFDEIYERFKHKRAVTGLATGFHELDHLTAGLHPGNLVVVAARPSMGKTAFCLSLAENVILNREQPGRVAVFSLEMSAKELVSRVLCSNSSVNAQDARRGSLKDHDWQRLTRGMNNLSDALLYIDDTSNISVLEIKSKCRRLQKRKGLDLVIIDYLQLMRGSGKTENRAQEISEISRGLKAMAKELAIPVMALSQVGRGVEGRQDKRPTLSDLRESGAIEQDADLVAFIYRDEYYNPHSEKVNIAEVILAKQRNGPVDSMELAFVKQFASFRNLEKAS